MRPFTALLFAVGIFLTGFMWGQDFAEVLICRQPIHTSSPLPFVPSEH